MPVAYHKSRLADGTEIKKGKLRGVVSEGMFCSVAEFGISSDLVLPEEAQGIYIFPEGTPIGLDVKDVLGLNDTVYEFELTANRADCFSMVGLSREFGVMTNQKLYSLLSWLTRMANPLKAKHLYLSKLMTFVRVLQLA